MKAPRTTLPRSRFCVLACGLLVTAALSGCTPDGGLLSAAGGPDSCEATATCDSPGQLAMQARLDAEAILAGMAHARARLGLQEDAAP